MAKSKLDLKPTESQVLDAVCEYLHHHKYFFFRSNNIPVYDPTRGTHRALPKYAIKGVSDLIMVHRGQTHFIEVKTPTGKQSPHQKAFQAMVEENGCDYYVVRSTDDLRTFGF